MSKNTFSGAILIFGMCAVLALVVTAGASGTQNSNSSTTENANSGAQMDHGSMKMTADHKFAMEAAMGGLAEVELGKVAASKGATDEGRQFGQAMGAARARREAPGGGAEALGALRREVRQRVREDDAQGSQEGRAGLREGGQRRHGRGAEGVRRLPPAHAPRAPANDPAHQRQDGAPQEREPEDDERQREQ